MPTRCFGNLLQFILILGVRWAAPMEQQLIVNPFIELDADNIKKALIWTVNNLIKFGEDLWSSFFQLLGIMRLRVCTLKFMNAQLACLFQQSLPLRTRNRFLIAVYILGLVPCLDQPLERIISYYQKTPHAQCKLHRLLGGSKNRIIIIIMLVLSICFLFHLCWGLEQQVTWVADNYMQSGVIQVLTGNTLNVGTLNSTASPRQTYQYQVTFNTTFTTATSVNIGIIGLQVPVDVSNSMFLINSHDNRTATGFIYYLTLNVTNQIINLKINYLCLDGDQMPAIQLKRIVADPANATYLSRFASTSVGTGYRQTTFPVSYSDPINMSHEIIITVFIKAFGLRVNSSSSTKVFTMGVRIQLQTSTSALVTFWTDGGCTLFYSQYYSLLVDKTQIELTQKYFMDDGTIQGYMNMQTTQAVVQKLVNNGYIFGANFFSFNFSTGTSRGFDIAIDNCTVATLGDGYLYVNISYFNFRIRGCSSQTPYYYKQNQLCYDSCPVQSYPNTSYNFCYSCSAECYTCPNATQCSSCNSSQSFRILNSTNCSCIPGYFETGSYVCGTCIDGCSSCLNDSSCVTCNATAGFQIKTGGQCVCNSTSLLKDKVCTNCSSVLLGCSSCQNSTACDSCLNLNYTYSSLSLLCSCNFGYAYIEANFLCQACSELLVGCLECDFTTVCTKCDLPFLLSISQCICADGTYIDTSSTPTCSKCDVTCLTCTDGSAHSCTTCASFLTYDSAAKTCLCSNPDQVTNGTACIRCPALCDSLFCTGVSDFPCQTCGCACQHGYYQQSVSVPILMWINLFITLPQPDADCLKCNISDLASLSSSCTCPIGMYPNPSNSNSSCLPCDYTCFMCSSSTNTSCTRCNDTDGRSLNNSSCPCNPFYMDAKNNTPFCIPLVCDQAYSITSDGYCAPICADGLVASEQQCDDNNTVSGDGCSKNCKTEENYTCSGNTTAASVCSYNKPLQLKLVSIVKNPTSNNLTYTINITPNLPSLNSLNYSQLLNLGLPNNTIITYKYQNGVLSAEAQYFHTIQSIPTSITFQPSSSNASTFLLTPNTIVNYSVESTNNLAADVYPEEVYNQAEFVRLGCLGLIGLTFLTYGVGMYAGKLIATQMIWVVQLAFMGLLMLDFSDPLYQPMRSLIFINGYSLKFTDSQTGMPNRVSTLGYFNSLINNLNLMIGLQLVIGIVSLSLFVASKVVKSDALKTKLLSYSRLAIGEFMLTAVLFQVYHYGVSVCILVEYPYQQGMILYASMAEAGVFGGCIVAMIVLYALKQKDTFGEYKTFFKQTRLGQFFYLIPIGCRIVISCALGVLNGVLMGGIIVIGVLATELAATAAIRPYADNKHTIRECVNLLVGIIIMALYVFFGKRIVTSLGGLVNYVPYLILGLLISVVAMNLTFMILRIVQSLKAKKKNQLQSLVRQQVQQLTIFQQQTKKMLITQKPPSSPFSKKFKSKTPKARGPSESSITSGLLSSSTSRSAGRVQQFQNSLYPMMQNQEVNLQDIQFEPCTNKKKSVEESGVSKIEEVVEIEQVQQEKECELQKKEERKQSAEQEGQKEGQERNVNVQEIILNTQGEEP